MTNGDLLITFGLIFAIVVIAVGIWSWYEERPGAYMGAD